MVTSSKLTNPSPEVSAIETGKPYHDPKRRMEFVLLYDLSNGNPNGDPDNGNQPRQDPQTDRGIVTDAAIKRKVRNYISSTYGESSHPERAPFKIFVQQGTVLNESIGRAFKACNIAVGKPVCRDVPDEAVLIGLRTLQENTPLPASFTFNDIEPDEDALRSATLEYSGELDEAELKAAMAELDEALKEHKGLKKFINDVVKESGKARRNAEDVNKARDWMCANFYDVRMFGAVMSTGLNAGQVTGPMQIEFSQSIDPILIQHHTVTRCAVTNLRDKEKGSTMGGKSVIPYGLYRVHGYFSPMLGEKTRVTAEDLSTFWEALIQMWANDRSSCRSITPQALIVFTHNEPGGNAPAHKLLKMVKVEKNDGVEYPRSFEDYTLSIDRENIPEGVTLNELL